MTLNVMCFIVGFAAASTAMWPLDFMQAMVAQQMQRGYVAGWHKV